MNPGWHTIWCHFLSTQSSFFSISCSTGLLATFFFQFLFTFYVFSLLPILFLKDSFEYIMTILDIKFLVNRWVFFSFYQCDCVIPMSSGLTVSDEKSAINHIFFFLPFICHFSFGALKSLSFSNLSIVKVVVIFFLFILLKIHSASWIYNLKFFTKLGTFCHYFSKYFLFQIVPFPFLLSLGPQLCECWDYIVPQISEVLSTFLIVLQIG